MIRFLIVTKVNLKNIVRIVHRAKEMRMMPRLKLDEMLDRNSQN
jgi:hypothetical protein